MEPWLAYVLKVIFIAACILTVQLTLIVLGSRFGWFLWIIKRLLHLRAKYVQGKKENGRTNPDSNKETKTNG